MLVHKRSGGVLHTVACPRGREWVERRRLTLSQFPELDPEEWWEVPDRSPLGRKLLRWYPYFTPVLSERGELTDIIPWEEKEEENHADQNNHHPNRRRRRGIRLT